MSPESGGEPDSEELNGPETYRDVGSTFHDILKARSLGLACPIQVIREETWTGKRPTGSKRDRPLQDEASRAWNLFTALYYKAGGTPWRLPRASTDLATCFVGVSSIGLQMRVPFTPPSRRSSTNGVTAWWSAGVRQWFRRKTVSRT